MTGLGRIYIRFAHFSAETGGGKGDAGGGKGKSFMYVNLANNTHSCKSKLKVLPAHLDPCCMCSHAINHMSIKKAFKNSLFGILQPCELSCRTAICYDIRYDESWTGAQFKFNFSPATLKTQF